MKARSYKITEASDLSSLADAVRASIAEGWQPIGGVTFTDYGTFIQAMILPE